MAIAIKGLKAEARRAPQRGGTIDETTEAAGRGQEQTATEPHSTGTRHSQPERAQATGSEQWAPVPSSSSHVHSSQCSPHQSSASPHHRDAHTADRTESLVFKRWHNIIILLHIIQSCELHWALKARIHQTGASAANNFQSNGNGAVSWIWDHPRIIYNSGLRVAYIICSAYILFAI